jgi:hypothetical protein
MNGLKMFIKPSKTVNALLVFKAPKHQNTSKSEALNSTLQHHEREQQR